MTQYQFVQTSAPEPGSLTLLGLGLIAVTGACRRWRRDLAEPSGRSRRRP
jgi:hypothetical protein